jgi:hypothetical protein
VRGKVRGGNKEDFRKLYFSVNIRMTTLRWIRWVDNVLFMGEMRNTYKILVGKPEKRDCFEYLCVDGRMLQEVLGRTNRDFPLI